MRFFAHAMWILLQPGNLLLLCFVAGSVLALCQGTRRAGLWVGGLATATLILVALVPLGQLLLRPLENRFPQPTVPVRIDGIVVLGGGQNGGLTADRGRIALNDNGERLIEAVALIRDHPEARVIFTGGNGVPGMTEADVARRTFDALGLDTDRIVFEAVAADTWDNAVYAMTVAKPLPGETWLLITSAWHMPRAMACFRSAGWQIVPFPVDFRTPREGGAVLMPGLERNLRDLSLAIHEYVGLIAYRLLGRTRDVFPEP